MIDNGFYSASARITNIEIEMRVILCKCGILQFLVSLLLWCVCVCVCVLLLRKAMLMFYIIPWPNTGASSSLLKAEL